VTTSRIQAVTDAAEAELSAVLTDITFGFGRLDLAKHASPPRVVWVPTGAELMPAENRGGKAHTTAASEPQRKDQIGTRAVRVIAFCWAAGATYDAQLQATEQLVHNVYAALRRSSRADLIVTGEQWMSQDESDAGWPVRGQIAAIDFQVRVPVFNEIIALTDDTPDDHGAPLTIIAAEEHSADFDDS